MCFRKSKKEFDFEIEFNETWKTSDEVNELIRKFLALLASCKDCPIDELADIINELKRVAAYSGTTLSKVLEYANKKEDYTSGYMV